MTDIYEALNAADVRIEKLFWLPAIAACGSPPQDFRDFCEDDIEDREVREINLPALTAAHSEADGDADDFVEYLMENLTSHRVPGFIVQIATPVTRHHREGGGYTCSWGHYTTTCRYVKTAEEIVPLATAWAHERREADRKREAAKDAPTPGTAGEGGEG